MVIYLCKGVTWDFINNVPCAYKLEDIVNGGTRIVVLQELKYLIANSQVNVINLRFVDEVYKVDNGRLNSVLIGTMYISEDRLKQLLNYAKRANDETNLCVNVTSGLAYIQDACLREGIMQLLTIESCELKAGDMAKVKCKIHTHEPKVKIILEVNYSVKNTIYVCEKVTYRLSIDCDMTKAVSKVSSISHSANLKDPAQLAIGIAKDAVSLLNNFYLVIQNGNNRG